MAPDNLLSGLPKRDRVWLAIGLAVPAAVASGLCYLMASQGLGWRFAVVMTAPWLAQLPFSPFPGLLRRPRAFWWHPAGIAVGLAVWALVTWALAPTPSGLASSDAVFNGPPVGALLMFAAYSWWFQRYLRLNLNRKSIGRPLTG